MRRIVSLVHPCAIIGLVLLCGAALPAYAQVVVTPPRGPTGVWLYDYQTLAAALVALISVWVTYAISTANRQHELRKLELQRANEREDKQEQQMVFFNILLEDLELVKEELEQEIGVVRDVCSQLADPALRGEVTDEYIDRVITTSRPRLGMALLVDWKEVEFLSSSATLQYVSRVTNRIRLFDEAIEWTKQSLKKLKDEPREEDLRDLQEFVLSRKQALFTAIEQLRKSPLRVARI